MRLFLQKSRHQSVYYFRRKVPVDLRQRIGHTQLYRTLRTSDRREAVVAARRLAVLTDTLFDMVRRMSDSDFKNTPLGRVIAVRLATAPLQEQIDQLKEELLDNQVTADKRISDLKADHNATLARLLAEAQAATGVAAATVSSSAAPVASVKKTITIREAVDSMLSSGTVKPRSAKRYKSIFAHLGDFLGWQTQMHEVTAKRFAEYADHVNASSRAIATKGDYVTIAGRLFNWAHVRDPDIPEMRTAGLKAKRTMPAFMARDEFTMDEIGALFQHVAKFRTTKPHRFWATVAPAFMGCRIEELAQADLDTDIKQDAASGVWYLNVSQDDVAPSAGGKSVKKFSSWRNVPIHSALVRHGFIDYLKAEKEAGAKNPFERHWKPWHDKETGGVLRSHSIVKWGSRQLALLRRQGAVRNAKTTYFHSLRHTLITQLALKGIPPEWRAALCGQEAEGGVNEALYAKLRSQISALTTIVEDNLDDYVEHLNSAVGPR